MRLGSRPSPLQAVGLALALGLTACGGGQAANEDLEDQVAETKELAYQAALSAEQAKNAAAEALAAAGGRTAAEGEHTGTTEAGAEAAHGEESGAETSAGAEHGAAAGAHETAAAPGEVHWTYSGATGPDHWAEVSEEFKSCESGMKQSPIDLTGQTLEVGLDDITVDWAPSDVSVVDNGHTIQANVQPGNKTTIDGVPYELVQFHFHKPSEHTMGKEIFPLELHFVHKNAAGGLAVLGVLLQVGEPNPAYDVLWAAQPEKEKEPTDLAAFDLHGLLPANMHSYRYSGSLTTPPCTEGVSWNVLATPATVSQEQIDGFVYDHNNRPVQPIHDRLVLADKS
jgi:carbonic anhydrase